MYWINSGVYNLDFKPFLPGLHDWKTVFGVLGYFQQYFMLCYLQGFISKILTVWQYRNSERGTVSNTGSTAQNRLFWSTVHVQDCFKQSPGLYSTRTVSNTTPVSKSLSPCHSSGIHLGFALFCLATHTAILSKKIF